MSNHSKDILRQEARRALARIDLRADDPEDAAAHFFEAINPAQDKIVAAYWPREREFDVLPILEGLVQRGNICALPVVREGTLELGFARWREGEALGKGVFGVMVPVQKDWVEPDIVIVPMLAFDRRGYRLGQGGGYYDCTLAALRARKDILAVGVAYAQQACLFNLPVEEHDQRLDWIVTPLAARKI